MVFHQPFLSHLSHHFGNSIDILIGKPMPVKTAAYCYKILNPQSGFEPSSQLQWLADTETRILEYITLAKEIGQKIKLNLEIDVGLHRGGFENLERLSKALKLIENNIGFIEFSGFMGYDPHVVKIPKLLRSPQKAFHLANDFYQDCIKLLREKFPRLYHDQLTFNGAGSPTIDMHVKENSVLNEISAGSCLVKPTTFDIPSLEDYSPACFIATPVLKKLNGTLLPGIERFKNLFSFFNPKLKNAYFIYGGNWKADYYYPEKTLENALFGSSTNQTLINTASKTNLEVDEFIFLRPHQSEFVFLQFGNILTIRNQEITGEWSLLNQV